MSPGYAFGKNEINSVLAQPSSTRYSYFVKRVADWGEVWSLSDLNGLVVYESSEGVKAAAFWPFKEFAECCAVDMWDKAAAESIELDHFLNELLLEMKEKGFQIAVFPDTSSQSILVDPVRLKYDIEDELDRLE